MKKIYSILLLVIAVFAIALADNTDKILRIYHNGNITDIPLSEIKKISHSKYDADNVLNSENVTSVFETVDETYNIPINSIDSADIVNFNDEINEHYEEIYSYILAQEEQELSVFQTNITSWLNNKSWVYSTFINDRKDNITITIENGLSFYINFQPVPFTEETENNSQPNNARKKSDEAVIYYDVSYKQGEKILDNLNMLYIQCVNMLLSRAQKEETSIRDDIKNSPVKFDLEVSPYTTGLGVLDKDFAKYGMIIISQAHGYLDCKNGKDIKGPFQIEDDSAYYQYFNRFLPSKGFLIYLDNHNYIKQNEIRKTFVISPELIANKLMGNNDAIVYGNYCWSFGLADYIKGNTIFGYLEESHYFYNTNALMKFVKEMVLGATVYDANERVNETGFFKYWYDNQPSLNNNSKERYFSITTNDLEYDEGQIVVSGIINGYKNFKDEYKKGLKGVIYEHEGTENFTPASNGVKKYDVSIKDDGTYEARITYDGSGKYGYMFGFDKYYGPIKIGPKYILATNPVEDNEKGETSVILRGSIQGDLTCDGIVGFYFAEDAGTALDPIESERVYVTAASISGLQDGNFSYELTGLKPNTQYVFNTYAEVEGNRFYGDLLPFQTKRALEVETGGYTYNDNDPTQVTLLGTIPNFSLFDMDEQGFEAGFVYDTHQSLNLDNAQHLTVFPIGDPNFSGLAENLEEHTTYYYAAYIKKGEQVSYGEEKSFTTNRWLTIQTLSATGIDSKSATLNGQVHHLDKISEEYELGFYYGMDENLTSSNYCTIVEAQNDGGAFKYYVNNLSPETEYYFMASIKVGGETLKGNIMKFQTKKEEDDIEIAIETQTATDVRAKSAQLNGCVDGLEDLAGEYELGFYYGNSRDIDPNSAQYISIVQQNQNLFYTIAENLTPDTDYYFMASIDINGTKQFGNVLMLHTLQKEAVKTIGSSDIKANSVKLSGQIPDFKLEEFTDVQGEIGFVIGLSSSLSIEGLSSTKIKVSDIHDLINGDFSSDIDGLEEQTTYYYVAYIVVDGVVSYGEIMDFTTPRLLNVKTLGAGNIKATSAQVLGQAFNLSSVSDNYQLGFYYSTESEPGSANGIYVPSQYIDPDGSFYASLSGLEGNTRYYYVAIIEVGGETIFSDNIGSFVTEEAIPGVAEPVDLGLSVKWASWNLGASKPEEPGGFYAIGELQPKEDFSWENYLVDTSIQGCFSATQYDAAYNTWGKEWRLPTYNEIAELLNNCTEEYIEQNGVEGVKITGKNGNSIFLPKYENATSYSYLSGDCNSNTVRTLHYYYSASYLFIDKFENEQRFKGFPIRPVYDPDFKEMSVETLDASDLKVYSATLNGKVDNPHWMNTTEVGFYYNTTGDPKEGNGEYISINKSGEFYFVLNDLAPSTTYYYVTAAKVLGKTHYGETKSFTTIIKGTPSSAQLVDLGLSVNWAGYNVGASSPTGIGNYFPWGMTEELAIINYQTYEPKDGDKIKKIGENISGTKYDAARHNWGGSWRMPTIEEWDELFNRCTIENYIMDGVKGISVTGPNGNCIFLPESGYKTFGRIEQSTTGYYWSATYYNDRGNDYDWAQNIWFYWSEAKLCNPVKSHQKKSTGYVVRAVKSK